MRLPKYLLCKISGFICVGKVSKRFASPCMAAHLEKRRCASKEIPLPADHSVCRRQRLYQRLRHCFIAKVGIFQVFESFSWEHGILVGALVKSEATAAAEHTGKQVSLGVAKTGKREGASLTNTIVLGHARSHGYASVHGLQLRQVPSTLDRPRQAATQGHLPYI